MKEEAEMPSSEADQAQFVKESALYKEFLAERAEILKHKWIESEKAGADIGTMPFKVLDSMFSHPLTDKGLEQFLLGHGASQAAQ